LYKSGLRQSPSYRSGKSDQQEDCDRPGKRSISLTKNSKSSNRITINKIINLPATDCFFKLKTFNTLAGFSGRWMLSAEEASFSEATFHQFCVSANVVLSTFKPGMILKIPLNENLSDALDLVIGLTLGFNLN